MNFIVKVFNDIEIQKHQDFFKKYNISYDKYKIKLSLLQSIKVKNDTIHRKQSGTLFTNSVSQNTVNNMLDTTANRHFNRTNISSSSCMNTSLNIDNNMISNNVRSQRIGQENMRKGTQDKFSQQSQQTQFTQDSKGFFVPCHEKYPTQMQNRSQVSFQNAVNRLKMFFMNPFFL